jgi:hypothetical protein
MSDDTPAPDEFIPVRKKDLIAQLDAGGRVDTEKFHALCKMLGAIYHYTYFEQLERLRADYYYFNPQIDPHERCSADELDRSYSDLGEALTAVLKAGNFVEVPHGEIERAHREHGHIRVETKAPLDDFREVRFFRRGHRRQTIEVPALFGLRTRAVECDVYDDVLLFVAMKPDQDIVNKRDRKRFVRDRLRPGSVLIKHFRQIPGADLNALFPNVRVVMSNLDRLMLGVPALAGGIPILLNLIPALNVLFLVAGFYLGISGAVHEDDTRKALAALSGLAALGGFLLQQWIKYQRQSLKYQKLLSDNVYFRNVNNNAGIFDYLIGMAEEQECKEAFLAYYFILSAASPPAQTELDATIEQWLHTTFGIDVDFEVDDALGKLERLGLLRHDGERLTVLPLDEALARLDVVWDGFFDAKGHALPSARA